MNENVLLKAKSEAQRRMGGEAKGRLGAYADRLREHVRRAEKRYGVTFIYDDGKPAEEATSSPVRSAQPPPKEEQ